MDRGTWKATVHRVTKVSDTTVWFNTQKYVDDTMLLRREKRIDRSEGWGRFSGGVSLCMRVSCPDLGSRTSLSSSFSVSECRWLTQSCGLWPALPAFTHITMQTWTCKVNITSDYPISLSSPDTSPGSRCQPRTDRIPSAEVTLRLLSDLEWGFYFTICCANRMPPISSTAE